ncbi:MAG: hypothetical protein U0165_05465 [Polyangiaceae bacterium]
MGQSIETRCTGAHLGAWRWVVIGALVIGPAVGSLASREARAEPGQDAAVGSANVVPAVSSAPCACVDPAASVRASGWFDITAGTMHGYPASLVGKYNDDTELLPTTSALFMAEYAFVSRLRAAVYYDLITTTERKVVSGTFVEKPLPSRVAAGLALAPFFFDFAKGSRLELQGYGLLGATIEHKPKPVPVLMGRVHLMQDKTKGVGVYLGTSYQFVIDKLSVLYGVSYRF